MSFLRNYWYCAAWADELSRTPLARTILGEKLVLFRKIDGSVTALGAVCPHRFAPLSEGKLHNDNLACRYHGLQFGSDGRCVHNPHGDTIPPALRVPAYTVVERYGAAWIWMGDPKIADQTGIPELWGHGDDGFRTIHGYLSVKCGYELISDNLLDLSHTQFLHSFLTMEEDADKKYVFEIQQNGEDLTTLSNHLNAKPFGFARFVWPDCPERINSYAGIRWEAPANMLLKVHLSGASQSEAEGLHSWGAELVTPETETTCHYFWSNARDFRLDDAPFEQALQAAISGVFTNEDAWILALVQQNMGSATDLISLKPVILASDNAAIRARRIIRKLLREEVPAGRIAEPAAGQPEVQRA
jgi:vanillate O-demethylase monooxygenase subunit